MTPPATGVAANRAARRRRSPAANRAVRPAVAPWLPRRVSGPARPAQRQRQALLERVLERLRALPDAPVVDRLVRGRAWIVLIGFLLMGMVAMQVSLLKINASMGRAVQQSANLERRNGELRATLSRLSAGQRVQLSGARLGMFMPDAGQVHFLSLRRGRDARRAATALRADRVVTAVTPPPTPAAPSAAGAADQVATPADQPSAQTASGTADSPGPGGGSPGPADTSGGGTVAQGPPASADAASTGGAQPPASG